MRVSSLRPGVGHCDCAQHTRHSCLRSSYRRPKSLSVCAWRISTGGAKIPGYLCCAARPSSVLFAVTTLGLHESPGPHHSDWGHFGSKMTEPANHFRGSLVFDHNAPGAQIDPSKVGMYHHTHGVLSVGHLLRGLQMQVHPINCTSSPVRSFSPLIPNSGW